MLKILQARLYQYLNHKIPDVQAGFRKGRGTRDQIANIRWIIKKAREFPLSILKDSRLEMRTKTCIVTAKNDWTVLHKMDNLFKDMWNENSIMQCVQSASAVTIIADRMLKDRVIDTVGRFNLIKIRENLVEIVVKSPEKIVDTAGVIAYLITNLSDAGINLEETVSCHTDTIFIVNEPDMINAYSVLTKCIQSAEETVGNN